MQLYELIEIATAPQSPGSRPAPPSFDPLPVARETAEQVYKSGQTTPPSPAKVAFAVDVKTDGNDDEDDSAALCTSRRADSVASCASEWVNQRNAVRSETELSVVSNGTETGEPVSHSVSVTTASQSASTLAADSAPANALDKLQLS